MSRRRKRIARCPARVSVTAGARMLDEYLARAHSRTRIEQLEGGEGVT